MGPHRTAQTWRLCCLSANLKRPLKTRAGHPQFKGLPVGCSEEPRRRHFFAWRRWPRVSTTPSRHLRSCPPSPRARRRRLLQSASPWMGWRSAPRRRRSQSSAARGSRGRSAGRMTPRSDHARRPSGPLTCRARSRSLSRRRCRAQRARGARARAPTRASSAGSSGSARSRRLQSSTPLSTSSSIPPLAPNPLGPAARTLRCRSSTLPSPPSSRRRGRRGAARGRRRACSSSSRRS
mmetsp:Transcript_67235/g.165987  ORF Transcript_67235/g.165987 Transcript_67235/m.165987 type:complete len:236 (-) Transcript_67235:619-1326(-)